MDETIRKETPLAESVVMPQHITQARSEAAKSEADAKSKNTLAVSLIELSRKIKPTDAAAADRLNTLAEYVNSNIASKLAKVDLRAYIDVEGIVNGYDGANKEGRRLLPVNRDFVKLRERSRNLEWFRNILILAPLLLTWLAIFFAANNYRDVLNNPPTAQQLESFFVLWQRGFPGHGGITIGLSEVAFGDCVLIGFVVGITGYVLWADRKADTLQTEATTRLRRELTSVMAGVAVHFAEVPSEETDEIAKIFGKSIEQLTTGLEVSVNKLVANVKTELYSVKALTQTTRDTYSTQIAEVSAMSKANKNMADGLTKFATQLGTATASLNQAATQVSTAVTSVSGQMGQFQTRIQSLETTQTSLVSVLTAISTQMQEINRQQQQAAQDQNAFLKGLTDLMRTTFTEAISGMNTAAGTLHQVANATVVAGTGLSTAVDKLASAQSDLLGSYANDRVAQQNIIDNMRQTSANMATITGQMNGFATSLSGVSTELNQIAGVMRTVPTDFNQQITGIAKEQLAASAQITQASTQLQSAAQQLNDGLLQALARMSSLIGEAKGLNAQNQAQRRA